MAIFICCIVALRKVAELESRKWNLILKYKLKPGTDKKRRELFYLSLFFALIIWVLMVFLFYGDENPQTLLIYLAGSAILLPLFYFKKIKPYFQGLTDNVNNAYVEVVDNRILFRLSENFKKHNHHKREINIADIINVKKAFRKDDSINKVTLTLRDKSKIEFEDFENMDELLEEIFSTSEAIHGQSQEPELD